MYAFWRYSGFPGVLGGHVVAAEEGALGTIVQVREYASHGPNGYGGGWFDPLYLLDDDAEGEALLAQLMVLRAERDLVLVEVDRQYNARMNAALATLEES